ncbi:PaaI family thioesterase [Blastococcus brunescens]|uniref:PaaI family thioesterase n=1 Tax=Blastococcus brunescens TaxID=1564165 RepID=A0ABZ1B1H7_9ACTN|nr:PaaI family thioesterase [Blastococcus sp. BMG 8361]WRL63601.1 PaaI family thioesterase [Blastococcus sp. BMG 8361]
MTEALEISPVGRAALYAREVPQGSAIDTMGIRPTWAADGTARAEMVVEDHHLNQVGVVQGGVYALLADAVAGWAAMSVLPEGKSFVTLDLRINLLRAIRSGSRLIAEALPVHSGSTTLVFEVRVHADSATAAKPAAFFVCTQLVVSG